MSRVRVVQCCVSSAAVWLTSSASAQSIDPSSAVLALHRPFSLHLPVRTAEALAAPALARCVDAEFQSGSTLLFSDQMQVSLRPAGREGWQWLVFEHPHVVQERALQAHVVLRCPARFEREFTLQAQEAAPVDSALAVVSPPRLEAPQRPTPPPASTPRITPTQRSAPASPSAVLPAPVPAPSVRLAPATHTSGDSAAEADRLRIEIQQLKAALATARLDPHPAASPPVTPITPAVTTPSIAEAGAPLLREDPVLLAGAGALAALLPLLRWWRQRCRLPKLHTMDIALPAEATPPAGTPSRTTTAACVILEERPETVDLIPPTAVPAGAASLADRDAARFTHQVRGLVADGYLDAAVGLLEKTLAASPARNPWLMLQLLELYETMGETGLAARLIGELQTLYRVQLPTLDGVSRAGRSLLEMPALLREIEQAWASDEVTELLEDLVHRSPGPTWDLATFQDLLLLHAIATDRAPVAPAALLPAGAFEPVLEWTVDEP